MPRNLPALLRDALAHGWDINVEQNFRHQNVVTARFDRPSEWVIITWLTEGERATLQWTEINATPTTYKECRDKIRTSA